MNCTYLKIKINHNLECKKQKKIINIRECNNCAFKEYEKAKCTINKDYCANSKQIKRCTYKQTKKEKQRYSIIYNDLSKCCVDGCLTPYYNVEKNEVYEGAKRSASIKYGFVCPLCENHHAQFHNDREFALYFKRIFQTEFEKINTHESFLAIIHANYLNDS